MGGIRIIVSGRDAMRLDKNLFPLRVIGHVAIDRIKVPLTRSDFIDSPGLEGNGRK